MARGFERFEVKNEMRDVNEIRPDDDYRQTGGKKSKERQEEMIEDEIKVGGFDDFEIDLKFEEESLETEEELDIEKEENQIGFNDFEFGLEQVEPIQEMYMGIEAITNEEVDRLLAGYRNTSVQGEVAVASFIGSQAKKLNVDKKELKLYLRQQEKSRIHSSEKVLHYHRTSMENAKKILESGYLLNRANIQLNGGDISHLSGSSSANVQFTVDKYDENGQLQISGYDSERESIIGAASTDVVFVMGPELLEEESYDCFYQYPTVEKANIQQCCATILAKNPEILKELQNSFKENGIKVPIMLQEEFDREAILESLTTDKHKEKEIQDEVEEILITNSDVEQELSEYYTDDITFSEIETYFTEKIQQVYGDRLDKAGIDIGKFLEGQKLKLEYFDGAETYKEITEELDSILEDFENMREQKENGIEQEETVQEETIVEEPIQEEKGFRLVSINGKNLEQLITTYRNIGINNSDFSKARETLAQTKYEREQSFTQDQTQPNKDDFEGR